MPRWTRRTDRPPLQCVQTPRSEPSGNGHEIVRFRDQLAIDAAGETVTVWRRQMVLGPAPEYRVTAGRELANPAEMAPVACELANLSAT